MGVNRLPMWLNQIYPMILQVIRSSMGWSIYSFPGMIRKTINTLEIIRPGTPANHPTLLHPLPLLTSHPLHHLQVSNFSLRGVKRRGNPSCLEEGAHALSFSSWFTEHRYGLPVLAITKYFTAYLTFCLTPTSILVIARSETTRPSIVSRRLNRSNLKLV